MPKYTVKDGWQVKHDGKRLQGGDTFTTANNNQTKAWVANGWIEKAEEKKSTAKKSELEPPKTDLTAARQASTQATPPKSTQRR